VEIAFHGALGGFHELFGRIEVRKSLGQVDGSAGDGDAGHLPDDGFGELFEPGCGFGHAGKTFTRE
jgi:hypothetical protein